MSKGKSNEKPLCLLARYATLSTHAYKKQPTFITSKYTAFLPIFKEFLPENKAEFILPCVFWIANLFKFIGFPLSLLAVLQLLN